MLHQASGALVISLHQPYVQQVSCYSNQLLTHIILCYKVSSNAQPNTDDDNGCADNDDDSDDDDNAGVVVVAVIGGLIFIALVAIMVILIIHLVLKYRTR